MADYGFRWTPATAGMFVPFEDGTASSSGMTTPAAKRKSAGSHPKTCKACGHSRDVKRRLRDALRPSGETATSGSAAPPPATKWSAAGQ